MAKLTIFNCKVITDTAGLILNYPTSCLYFEAVGVATTNIYIV